MKLQFRKQAVEQLKVQAGSLFPEILVLPHVVRMPPRRVADNPLGQEGNIPDMANLRHGRAFHVHGLHVRKMLPDVFDLFR